jgi:hypothetical protein
VHDVGQYPARLAGKWLVGHSPDRTFVDLGCRPPPLLTVVEVPYERIRLVDKKCSTTYLIAQEERDDQRFWSSRVIPVFESDNMAKRHHTRRRAAVSSAAPPEAIRMEFARRLQAALHERGWTQAELARRMAPLLISCGDDGHAPRS